MENNDKEALEQMLKNDKKLLMHFVAFSSGGTYTGQLVVMLEEGETLQEALESGARFVKKEAQKMFDHYIFSVATSFSKIGLSNAGRATAIDRLIIYNRDTRC